MAEIAISAVINKAVDVAADLIITHKASSLLYLQEKIRWIEREMRHILSFLEDSEAKQAADQRVPNLVNDIKDLAYDMEDILDQFFSAANFDEKKGFLRLVKSALCIFHSFHTTHSFTTEIEKLKIRVEDIDRVRRTYCIGGVSGDGGRSRRDEWEPRRHFLHVDEPHIVGFDRQAVELKAKLLNDSLEHRVISIVGMPGLGKTTLAKKVYGLVKQRFECDAMVYVSQEPNVKLLLQDIARQVGLEKEKCEYNLEVNLSSYLCEKRYLIFLDDIWNTETWDSLQFGIPSHGGGNGSRIIVTSRKSDVGRYIGGEDSLYELQPLDANNSWKLFSKMIMTSQETRLSQELEHVGRQIMRKCGGVPLAIVVTAGMLRSRERREHAWRCILDRMGKGSLDKYSKILALSYIDLPTKLKPCFLYFGLFPENHEISAFKLISLWMAEKFIQTSGKLELEEEGEEILNDLAARNLIQVVQRRFDGRIKTCRVHDLLHSLCTSMAKEGRFFNAWEEFSNSTARVRRIAIQRNTGLDMLASSNYHGARAFLWFDMPGVSSSSQTLKSAIRDLKFLRVLSIELSHDHISSIPHEIGNLRQLNYFQLACPSDEYIDLPSTMRNLKNLSILDVEMCLSRLPACVWKMKRLRHLRLASKTEVQALSTKFGLKFINSAIKPFQFPPSNILTLHSVSSHSFHPRLLYNLINLRQLGISIGVDDFDFTEAMFDALSNWSTPKLEKLTLVGPHRVSCPLSTKISQLNLSGYESLQKLHLSCLRKLPTFDKFPPNLTRLTLKKYRAEENPLETLKRLPKLKILKFTMLYWTLGELDCSGSDSFPQLQLLHFEGVPLLYPTEIIACNGAMPRLEKIITNNSISFITEPEKLSNIVMEIS